MKKNFLFLNDVEHEALFDAIHYLNMAELKYMCTYFKLPPVGKKKDLIERIITFIQTGAITTIPEIPASSRAKKGVAYPLAPHTKMLYGNYKNDAATRAFMKTLVGKKFHYTAFGIDWLNARWLAGNPPTYAEFAAYWAQEKAHRTIKKAPLKKEWALLNFVEQFLKDYPDADRETVTASWKKTRAQMVHKTFTLLKLKPFSIKE